MGFGTTPVSTTVLNPSEFPVSSVAMPGEAGGNLIALEGASEATDSNNNKTASALVEDIERAGYIAATSPPSATNAGSDTSYTFSSQVNRVVIQNNTSASVNFAFDATATAGSLLLLPGTFISYAKKCTVLHLYTAAAQTINGSSSGNIVVLGAM